MGIQVSFFQQLSISGMKKVPLISRRLLMPIADDHGLGATHARKNLSTRPCHHVLQFLKAATRKMATCNVEGFSTTPINGTQREQSSSSTSSNDDRKVIPRLCLPYCVRLVPSFADGVDGRNPHIVAWIVASWFREFAKKTTRPTMIIHTKPTPLPR